MLRMFMASLKFLVCPWCCREKKNTNSLHNVSSMGVFFLNVHTHYSPAWPDRWCWEGWVWTSNTQSRWSWPHTTPCTGKGSWGCSDAADEPLERTPRTDAVAYTHKHKGEHLPFTCVCWCIQLCVALFPDSHGGKAVEKSFGTLKKLDYSSILCLHLHAFSETWIMSENTAAGPWPRSFCKV